MSSQNIETEIKQFLSSAEPEVLCIKGKWGVGKTYSWNKYLGEAKCKGIALSKYSYVSLFGLNSLEDLRYAIFENTIPKDHIGEPPDETTLRKLIPNKSWLATGIPWFVELASRLSGARPFSSNDIGSLVRNFSFFAVRAQIVCLDDLERAGDRLKITDVLGLASQLKEQRSCKVVLLLNDHELKDSKEFERNLEKVADQTLVFEPASEEAADIALDRSGSMLVVLRERIVQLGITNIRVIKKIERQASRLENYLGGASPAVLDRAITVLVIASWAVQQPPEAPPLAFLRSYNFLSAAMERKNEGLEVIDWQERILGYPFYSADRFEEIIIDGVAAGYFDNSELPGLVAKLTDDAHRSSCRDEFIRVWKDYYQGSLAVDDGLFSESLYKAAIDAVPALSLKSINEAVKLLRELDRLSWANEVISAFVISIRNEYSLARARNLIGEVEGIDEGLRAAIESAYSNASDDLDPLDVLRRLGFTQRWGADDIAVLARQTVDDFEHLFEEMQGENLFPAIRTLLLFQRQDDPSSRSIVQAATDALRRIAAKSPLRRHQVKSLGIDV